MVVVGFRMLTKQIYYREQAKRSTDVLNGRFGAIWRDMANLAQLILSGVIHKSNRILIDGSDQIKVWHIVSGISSCIRLTVLLKPLP